MAEIPTEAGDNNEITDGYQLKFAGKDYAKLQAGLKTETVITPDFEHNSKEENKNSENIFITGDNLDALKHLENAYSGKVDVDLYLPANTTLVAMALFMLTTLSLVMKICEKSWA